MLNNTILCLAGSGSLAPAGARQAFAVKFSLRRLHWHFEIGIELAPEDAQAFGLTALGTQSWSLRGTLEDTRPISADDLMCSSTSPDIVLLPLQSVELGVRGSGPIRSATYPLAGMYYGSGCHGVFDSFELAIHGAESWNEYTRQDSRAIGRSLEGKTLVLSSLPEGISERECFDRAYAVTRLLTLASGEGVTAHRQMVAWESGEQVEIWRVAKGDELGPGMLIPESCLEEFLTTSYGEWVSWSQDKQSLVTRVLSYLNMSTVGYLDVRLFHVMQAMESLANAWLETPALPNEHEQLRQSLLTACREWRDSGGDDPDGFWGSRVNSLFAWARLRQQLEELLSSRGVGLDAIGLDLGVLKKARDSVGHSGILPEELGENRDAALRQLRAGQLALQLLLLSELRYTGKMYDRTPSWVRIVDRDHFSP
ncbi:hypothetical protein KAX17_08470 [Candidatus Bipolaricaulota bacterium]|nr:hypothetical protein [Candidatus Bipolaricaulota bacterium]MCK4599615.1 hypothetical protein [Candidatus Bipolaricaulota bacterium]